MYLLVFTIFHVWRYLIPFSGLFPQIAITHQTPSASNKTFTAFAIPSQTPTPCPNGPIISWEYDFFQFVIADIFTDKIMHILLFLPFRQLLSRANQLLNSGSHSLLMFANLRFYPKRYSGIKKSDSGDFYNTRYL